jgi:dTDP-D-glucose 4,6-dehydratase
LAPPSDLWTPLIDTKDGLKATAEWYRSQQWL